MYRGDSYKDVAYITRIICNKKALRYVIRQLKCISDAYHNYIIDEIERRANIDYERQIQNDDK